MKHLLEKYNYDVEKDSCWLHATPSITAKSTFFYVQETGFFKCHSQYYTERENLNSYLILYTLSGSGMLKYDDKTFALTPGTAFFIDCMEYNYYKTTSEENWETCWLHFQGSNTDNYYSLFNKNCPTVVNLQDPETFRSTIFEIIEYNKTFSPKAELMCSKLIVSLLTDLLSSSASMLIPTSTIPNYLQDISSHIERNYLDSFSLDDLSSQFSVSKYHLSREFKKYYGVSINEYHIRLRIDLAKKLLRSSSISIHEISEKIGIENVSHFINLFKNRVFDTPLTYRKKWQHLD